MTTPSDPNANGAPDASESQAPTSPAPQPPPTQAPAQAPQFEPYQQPYQPYQPHPQPDPRGHGQPGQYSAYVQQPYQQGQPSWPPQAEERPSGNAFALAILLIGALLSLSYAGWAFTARRSIFADFAALRAVDPEDASSSDRMDTIWLVAAGLVAALGLVVLLVHLFGRRSLGAIAIGGLGVMVIGAAIIGFGLVLVSQISDATGTAAQGDRGVTATVVIGAGFVVVAAGQLLAAIGLVSDSKEPEAPTQYAPPFAGGMTQP